MNELEKKRFQKAKPDIPVALLEEVSHQLKRFESSSQFEMLSGVHLAQFFSNPESVPESLKQKTMEDLVSEGALSIGLDTDISKEHFSEILVILSRFIPESEEVPDHSPKKSSNKGEAPELNEMPSLGGRAPFRSDVPILSSVEAERKLTERYSRLKNDPNFDILKLKKITEYWDQAIIRAPFLEELTFREILEISVDHLLKKRSVGNTKVYCLIKAFDALFEEDEKRSKQSSTTPITRHLASVEDLPRPVRDIPEPTWTAMHEGASPLALALISNWEHARKELLLSSQKHSSLLRAALVSLPDSLSQEQFLVLMHAAEGKAEIAGELLEIAPEQLDEVLKDAVRIARVCFEEGASEEVKWLQGVLRGVAVAEDELLFPLQAGEVQEGTRRSALRIALLSLGAGVPEVNGSKLIGFWSEKIDGLQQIVGKVSKLASKEEQEELLQTLAPQIPSEVLLKALNKG